MESLLDPIIAGFKPVACANYDSEFKSLTATLKNTDPDLWDKRDAALKKIAGFAIHPNCDVDELAKQIRFLRSTLQTQVEDLRSAIVRTSAALCVVLHENLGVAFQSVFEFLLPSFVKQLAVKAVPTRESSHECILRVATGGDCGMVNERLPKILFSYAGDKDKIIRSRMAVYVHGICSAWETSTVQKHLGHILEYLLKAQADGESKVRVTARETIALLGGDFPDQIVKFVRSVSDPKQKKEIIKVLPDGVKDNLLEQLGVSLKPSGGQPVKRSITQQPNSSTKQGNKKERSVTPNPRRGSDPFSASAHTLVPKSNRKPQRESLSPNTSPNASPNASRKISKSSRNLEPSASVAIATPTPASARRPRSEEVEPYNAVGGDIELHAIDTPTSRLSQSSGNSTPTRGIDQDHTLTPSVSPGIRRRARSASPAPRAYSSARFSLEDQHQQQQQQPPPESEPTLTLEAPSTGVRTPLRTTSNRPTYKSPQRVESRNRQEKQKIAAKLASTIDLMSLNQDDTENNPPSPEVRGKPEPVPNGELLARLRNLREQVLQFQQAT